MKQIGLICVAEHVTTAVLLNAPNEGGSARGYLADLSRRERPGHHWRPRHDSERGLDILCGAALGIERPHLPR
jgi:hypothetical protein